MNNKTFPQRQCGCHIHIKLKMRSFKSSEHINEKGDVLYRGFDYVSLVSGPLDMATWSQRELLTFCNFQQGSRYKDYYYLNGTKYVNYRLENES